TTGVHCVSQAVTSPEGAKVQHPSGSGPHESMCLRTAEADYLPPVVHPSNLRVVTFQSAKIDEAARSGPRKAPGTKAVLVQGTVADDLTVVVHGHCRAPNGPGRVQIHHSSSHRP